MKILKKITAIAAATAMAAGMSSVFLFAEDAYTLHVDSKSASVGETVAVNVVIDTGSTGVGAIAFKLNYDPDELELISAKPGDDLKGWITGDVDSDGNNSLNLSEAGTIGFGYVAMGSGFSGKSASIINASFTVLKPNAKFTLTDVVIGANDIDGTDITEQGSFDDNSVIECSHKNTEENITEATCKDEGKRDVTCIDCGKLVKTETIAKTNDHTWDNGTVTIKPTCDKKGVKIFTCTVCNETKCCLTRKTQKIDKQNANFQQPVESVENFQNFVQSNQNTKSSGEKKTRRFLHLNKFPDFAVKSLTNSFNILQLYKSAVVIIHIANGRRSYLCNPRQFRLRHTRFIKKLA